ncbi:protein STRICTOSIDINE SYNTHASE-LIKE 3-like [Aegilops tauschii subsp. strangulata]|uniref:protein STRICTOSIDINE SYNTHASE-LIKE 3-like n=1 Tax=Aegilops tauschii subsp. strangulata TaxID=200361 RepID=UPI003CC8A309
MDQCCCYIRAASSLDLSIKPSHPAQVLINQESKSQGDNQQIDNNMGCSMSRLLKTTVTLIILVLLLMPGALAATSFDASRSQQLPLPRGTVHGPESVAFDGQGQGPYSGVSDGRILKWNGEKLGWTTYAYGPGYDSRTCRPSKFSPETETARESRCGRPLGLRFNQKSGDLYVADAYKGLMRVAPGGGEATVLVNQVDGFPLPFTNGVDVDQVTGQVYFTDSSMNYQRSQHEMVTRTGDSTGRLMRYDPRTSDVTVLQAGMTYPNGVALSADRTHLVVASTGPCKLLRHWIKGVNAGTSEPFADLPGYPDNVRPDTKGGYWVALHREKNELPFGRDSHRLAVRVGNDAKIVEEMRGPKKLPGRHLKPTHPGLRKLACPPNNPSRKMEPQLPVAAAATNAPAAAPEIGRSFIACPEDSGQKRVCTSMDELDSLDREMVFADLLLPKVAEMVLASDVKDYMAL